MITAAHNQRVGAAGILGTVVTYIISEIATYDAFLHGLASLLTAVGAGVSIYFMFKKKSSKSDS
jgi:uncharacterized membrane-anchored protein